MPNLQIPPKQSADKNTQNNIYIKRAVTAGVVSFILTLIVQLLFSLVIYLEIIPENAAIALSFIITLAGSFFSGYLTALSVPAMGLVNGIISGLSYFLIMFVFSAITAPGLSVNSTTLRNILICVLGAGAGGILSINLKANRRNKKRRKNRR